MFKNKIMKIKGEKGIAGIYQGIIISWTPVSKIKSQKLRKRVWKKKVGTIIRI